MSALSKPSEIAREALRLLASRRIEPTPDHYRQLYNEIAGLAPEAGHGAEGKLAHVAWGALIRDVVRQLDTHSGALTRARKKEGLDQLLARTGDDTEKLAQRLQSLLKSWSETAGAAGAPVEAAAVERHAEAPARNAEPAPDRRSEPVPGTGSACGDILRQSCELLAQVLELGLAPRLAPAPGLAAQALELAHNARSAQAAPELTRLAATLRPFLLQVELSGAAGSDTQQGLIKLLRLLIENVTELLDDDRWLRGQVAVVLDMISGPLDPARIDSAEKSLKQVIFKQGVLKRGLAEAKNTFKNLVSSFVERLGDFSASTGDYQDKLDKLAVRIASTDDVVELGAILEDVARATRQVQAATQRSREELDLARRQVDVAEQRIRQLESDLESVSEKVREDQLTGMLNRRGLDEAFERALAGADRKNDPLSVALLDIDNFKQLNDVHGHQAGDEALVHLAKIIRDTVRPTDILARYGGEEFLVLLPDSTLDDSMAVMTRVQRELTRRFFLHDNKRLLVTFSAGVALRAPNESRDEVVARADKALYQAKRSGKNRVAAAG
ncbi:MAG TPA: GGDEF domain-containing protein [Burkholderiales bacterium]|nr:GGDEF domain-containing protein [Burkholderiales bacterium]